MNARSLVGMTQGAKKRNARMLVAYAHPAGNPLARRLAQETWKDLLHIGVDPYGKARRLYRIGERLRPCVCAACCPDVRLTVRRHIMEPWGWPCSAIDPFAHVDIPDGTPARLLDEGTAKIVCYPGGRPLRVRIEWQYLSTEETRICDGSGVLPAKRSATP